MLGMWKIALISLASLFALLDAACAGDREVVEDLRDGVLNQHGLLEGALALSEELTRARRDAMLSQFGGLQERVRSAFSRDTREDEKAGAFVKRMHQELLQGAFNADCDGVHLAFESGTYNCVTSLVLALEFCRREKISAKAMQSGHHVWLRIGDQQDGDLETTRLTIPDEVRLAGVRISDAELLSRLLYNQARRRHEEGRFEEASKRLEWCLLIDADFEPAERNLRIVLGNWMIAASAEMQFAEAVAVGQRAVSRFPEDIELRQNAAYLEAAWDRWRTRQAGP